MRQMTRTPTVRHRARCTFHKTFGSLSLTNWPEDHMRGRKFLRAASLVSTTWVNRCQYHLFSTITFSQRRSVQEWCSRIEPGSEGVSRHVRVLTLINWRTDLSLVADVPKTAFPHLTSFQNFRGWTCTALTLTLHHSTLSFPSSLHSPTFLNGFCGLKNTTRPTKPGKPSLPLPTFCQTL